MIDTLLEKNILPDWVIRAGIRRLLNQRIAEETQPTDEALRVHLAQYADDLRRRPIADQKPNIINLSAVSLASTRTLTLLQPERIVFGVVSTGANNDLVVSTERARKMVREWERTILRTCTRCRLSWLPHSVHGMMGNCRCTAHFSRSVSAT